MCVFKPFHGFIVDQNHLRFDRSRHRLTRCVRRLRISAELDGEGWASHTAEDAPRHVLNNCFRLGGRPRRSILCRMLEREKG